MKVSPVPVRWAALVAVSAWVGCGFPETTTGLIELDLNEPPPGLDADVIVGGRLDIHVNGEVLTTYRVEGTLPADLPQTDGKVLILALRDISQPWLICEGAATASNCTVVVNQESSTPASVSLQSSARDVRFFLASTFALGEAPEPGCKAFLIGGTAVQWHVSLGENLVADGAFRVDLTMRRTQNPEVVFGWQLLLADPPSDPPSDQSSIGCN